MSMTAQLADGRTLSFPDGTDPAVIQATVKKVLASQPEEDPTSLKNLAGAATEPLLHLATGAVAGPIAGLAGMAAPLTNALGVTHTAPADVVRKVAEMATYQPHTTGGKNATEAITYPLQLLAEGADRAGGAVSDVTGSPMLGAGVNTAIQALPMLVGAKAPIAAPKTVLPIGGDVVSGAYRLLEPRLSNGPADILSRYQRGLAGSAKDQIIEALTKAQELVPGSSPTAAEAVASIPEASAIAAHQKAVSRTPDASAAFMARAADQSAARNASLDTIAQTPEALKAAEDTRSANAAENYGAVRGQLVSAPPADLLSRPSMQVALKDAAQGAKESDSYFPASTADQFSVGNLQRMKQSLDDAVRDPASFGIKATEAKEIGNTRDAFVKWLSEQSPAWEKARGQYAADSGPINQMEVGQYLSDKLNSALDQERPAAFAQAVRDAPGTIQRASDGPKLSELSDVLTPEQMKVVDAIQGDLARKSQADRLASGTNLGSSSPLGGNVNLPHMLSRPLTITDWALRTLKGADAVEPKINELAGSQYLDPVKLADSLTRQTTQEAIIEALLRARNPAILAGAAAAGER